MTTEQNKAKAWVLVPVEPTDAMTWAGQQARYPATNSIAVIYRAMLAAAPKVEPAEQAVASVLKAILADSCQTDGECSVSDELYRQGWEALAAQQAPAQPAGAFDYSFVCYSCSHEWEGRTPDGDCPKCGTTNRFSCQDAAAPAQPPAKVEREALTDAEIEAIAMKTEDAGHGWAGDSEHISSHGFFEPDSLRAFVRAIEAAVHKKLGIPAPTVAEKENGK